MDAIIIAGGKGSRMEIDVPKPLVIVRGKTLLEHQIDRLRASGVISQIILSLGHRADEIIDYIKNRYPTDTPIFSVETEFLGTAGGIKLALAHATTPMVLALNSDDILDIDLDRLAQCAQHTVCVAHPRLPFGRVSEIDGFATFEEKPLLPDWVSVGWYVFDREQIAPHLPEKGSLEYDVFPKIKLRMFPHEGFWCPLNTKKDIDTFEKGEEPGK
ncbi:MAG: NTP transferase domain-containing protein [Patescibacteria group bacterium]